MKFILIFFAFIIIFNITICMRYNTHGPKEKDDPSFKDLTAMQEKQFMKIRKYAKLAIDMNHIKTLDHEKWTMFKEIKSSDNPNVTVYGLINPTEKIVVVGFADLPKKKLKDFFTNLQIFKSVPEFCSTCIVLTDIYNKYLGAVKETDEMINAMIKKVGKGSKVRIIGHGIGGGLANLYAVHAQGTYMFNNLKLYTFGAVRVGDKAFASYSNNILNTNNIFRIVYGSDPISMKPSKKDGFKHSGTLYAIEKLPIIKNRGINDNGQESIVKAVYYKNHYKYNLIWEYKDAPETDDKLKFDNIKLPKTTDRKLLKTIKNN